MNDLIYQPTAIPVKYYDVEGFEHAGTAVFSMQNDDILPYAYLMIVDNIPEYNDKTFIMNDGNILRYAEVRRSDECIVNKDTDEG